ncbi:MAG TPA: DUF6776 family protein [Burkholderiaceae bacterium]|nr:DUF6776 family protein [Burkholderiaceae bacterium]
MEQPQQAHTAENPANDHGHKRAPARLLWVRLVSSMALLGCGMLIGGLAAHFAFERPALDAANARLLAVEQENARLRESIIEADRAAVVLEGQLRVEESTRRGLEAVLRSNQEELGRTKDALAFYEQMIPPGPKGAVTIRSLDAEQIGPHLAYRLLLMRSGSNEKPFEGKLQFIAQGLRDGQHVTLELQPTLLEGSEEGDVGAEELLTLRLENFQRGSGVLAMPEGFEPRVLTVNVLEGRNIRATRQVEFTTGD